MYNRIWGVCVNTLKEKKNNFLILNQKAGKRILKEPNQIPPLPLPQISLFIKAIIHKWIIKNQDAWKINWEGLDRKMERTINYNEKQILILSRNGGNPIY